MFNSSFYSLSKFPLHSGRRLARMSSDSCATEKKLPETTEFTDIVGGSGPWQRTIFIMVVLTGLPSAWHTLVMPFFAPNIDHWCAKPPEYENMSTEFWRLHGIPAVGAVAGDFSDYARRCQMYELANVTFMSEQEWQNGSITITTNSRRSLVPCEKWDYDNSIYVSTIVSQWDLVCDRSWTISTVNSLFMAGCLTSVIVFGQLSDRVGRKPILMTSVILLVGTGIVCAFSTSYMMFAVTRFFVALGTDGVFVIGFIILVEAVNANYRSVYGIAVNCGWCTGYVLLPLIAFLLKDWFWIQIAMTLPCIGLLSMYWLVPESPRWLLAHNKMKRAKVVLREAAIKNGKSVEDTDLCLRQLSEQHAQKEENKGGTILDLFRTSGLWQKTINLVFCWFVNSFVYYGLSFNTNDLAGNPFVNFALSGAVEFPAYVISLFVIKSLGRRLPLMITMVAGGLACMFTIFLTGDLAWAKMPLAMIGKFCVTASYAIIYVYTAEIFPTVVRNTGVGTCSMSARIGSILAPFVKELGRATHPAVPLVCYGGLTVVSGLLIMLLPETNKCKVPDTLQEAAELGRKKQPNSTEESKGKKICLAFLRKNRDRGISVGAQSQAPAENPAKPSCNGSSLHVDISSRETEEQTTVS